MSVSNIQQALLSTVIFFDLFDFVLTIPEAYKYLYGNFEFKGDLLSHAKQIPKLGIRDGFIFLKGRENLIELRKNKENIAIKYWRKTLWFCRLLSFFPFIKSVCVCNNLSYENVDKNSDIDLFVISEKNRLFSCRFLISFFAQILGVRRHNKKISGRFCLSFFISEENLAISKIALTKDDIYLAYWLKTLKPIIDKSVLKELSTKCNAFISAHFNSIEFDSSKQIIISPVAKKISYFLTKIFSYFGGNFIEKILKNWQIGRAKAKMQKLPDKSGTIISETILKFHDYDCRENIRNLWSSRIKKYIK